MGNKVAMQGKTVIIASNGTEMRWDEMKNAEKNHARVTVREKNVLLRNCASNGKDDASDGEKKRKLYGETLESTIEWMLDVSQKWLG